MNNKEALEQLLYYATLDDSGFEPHMKEYADIIKKDLELLELIKKHIVTKNFEYGSNFDYCNKISFTAEIIQLKDFTDELTGKHCTTFKVDNGFEKIKEWLNNEQ